MRLDRQIQLLYPDFSRSRIEGLVKSGHVTVNGAVASKAGMKTSADDEIEVEIPPPVPAVPGPEDIPLSVIFEDGDILVLDKPAGMVVHPAPGHATGTLVNALLHHCPDLAGIGGVVRPGLVHRLDKETSGIMLIAKNERFQIAMMEMFANREVHKTYNAICCGEMPQKEGLIDVPIGREAGGRIKASPVGREAQTKFKVKQQKGKFYWVELHPLTGRTNQLRVHMNWLGCPVLGDWLYKGATAPRLMLHARKLEFKNPITHRQECFEVNPPGRFYVCLESLKINFLFR